LYLTAKAFRFFLCYLKWPGRPKHIAINTKYNTIVVVMTVYFY